MVIISILDPILDALSVLGTSSLQIMLPSILAAIYAFRDRADAVVKQILPEPQASLMNDFLLGDDSGLPASVQEDFRRTGTTHIIAISG